MYKQLILLLILSLSLSAATPKLYKAIGDPVYKQISSVNKMSDIGYFKNEKKRLLLFVKEAKSHKKLGFFYDKKKEAESLTKEGQRSYLNRLRELNRELININLLAQSALPVFIKRRYVKSFRQLKATELSVLSIDSNSAWLIKKYTKELDRQKLLEQKRKAKERQEAAINYKKMLRSAKNLNGQWRGKSNDKSELLAVFEDERLSLSYNTAQKTNIFKGKYTIDKTFNFNIQSRKLVKSEKSHIRRINIQRRYEIKKINEKELVLQYKDEKLRLQRN